jgi:tetratricopeptide (TPR) repeat protein
MRAIAVVVFWMLIFGVAVARADAPPAGAADYLGGLTAFEHADYPGAVASMSKAIDADDENPDYRIGRAVGLIFEEKLNDAQKDLKRALKLRPDDRSAKMWLATDVAMHGDWSDTNIYPLTGDEFESNVRHMSHVYGQYFWELAENRRTGFSSQPTDAMKASLAGARAQFPTLSKQFAARAEASLQGNGNALSGVIRDRALQLVQQKNYADGLKALMPLLAATPDDPQLLGAHAQCVLALGSPTLARLESTRVLTHDLNNVDAYATRAVAAAQMGDSRRADSDLKWVSQINPAKVAETQAAVAAAAALQPAGFKPEELPQRLQELHQMAADGKPWDALVAQAVSINKGENAIRKRYDEDYQERLHILTLATQKQPQSAEAFAQLGEFLYLGAIDTLGEVVEPRAEFRMYRLATADARTQELAQASQDVDTALRLDPKNVQAVTTKSELLIRDGQWADAETLLRQALATNPNEPRVLRLFGRVMDYAASCRDYNAYKLRSTQSWISGDFLWTRFPSQADLDNADQLNQQGDQIYAIGSSAIAAAAQAQKGTADGFDYAFVIARRNGQTDDAISDLQQAIKLAPDRPEYYDALADLYEEKGQLVDASETRATAANLIQTTAAPMLRLAWQQIPMTQYKEARKSLDRAMALDPTDPRSAAYLSVIDSEDEKPDEAHAWMVVAAAQDEAKARMDGRSATTTAIGQVPASEVALGITLDVRAAESYLKLKQKDPALQLFDLAIAVAARVPSADINADNASSMLPSSSGGDPGVTIPPAHSIAESLAWAHLYRARMLAADAKPADAITEFHAVLNLRGKETAAPVAYASYALAANAMKHHDAHVALEYLNQAAPPRGMPQAFNQAYEKLHTEAQQQVWHPNGPNSQAQGDPNAPVPIPPGE